MLCGREMLEELHQPVVVERLLGVTENHFVVREQRGHDLLYNWLVRFVDEALYDIDEWTITESNGEILPLADLDERRRVECPSTPMRLRG